jgi:hypothetical protein
MTRRYWMIAAAGASAWAIMTSGAQAAPLGSAAIEPGWAAAARSGLEQVAYRLCWTEGGARQCRWVDNARIYGYRASRAADLAGPRAYGDRPPRVLGYAAPRAYRYRAAPVYRYAAPRVYGYRAARVYGYSEAPVYGYSAAPVYGYAAPAVYGYQAPALGYGPTPPVVTLFRRPMDYANPDEYLTGSQAWWSVMNRQGRGGQVD